MQEFSYASFPYPAWAQPHMESKPEWKIRVNNTVCLPISAPYTEGRQEREKGRKREKGMQLSLM